VYMKHSRSPVGWRNHVKCPTRRHHAVLRTMGTGRPHTVWYPLRHSHEKPSHNTGDQVECTRHTTTNAVYQRNCFSEDGGNKDRSSIRCSTMNPSVDLPEKGGDFVFTGIVRLWIDRSSNPLFLVLCVTQMDEECITVQSEALKKSLTQALPACTSFTSHIRRALVCAIFWLYRVFG